MNHSISFEKNKIFRFISQWGKTYTFLSPRLNKFGEPTSDYDTFSLCGVYHENNEYLNQTATDAGTIVTKLSTWILCKAEDATPIQSGMEVTIGGRRYKVTGKRDPNHLGIAVDISLEVILE